MCCSETQFIEQCLMLYCKLKTINDDIAKLDGPAGLVRFSNHMRVTAAATPHHTAGSVTSITPPGAEAAEAGVASAIEVGAMQDPLDNVMAVAFAIETLRIRHWLLRQAIGCLNHLFGMQLGKSVCVLCVMSVFDIYYETFHVMGKYLMSDLITYSWMLHYALLPGHHLDFILHHEAGSLYTDTYSKLKK